MNKIRVGLLGCGRISYKHLEALSRLDQDVEIICVCDIIRERADEKAKEINAKAYYDYDEMLNNEEIDLVSICTPSGLHVEHGVKAAEKGINVVTEKPMAVNIKAAEELIKACDKNNVQLFVVKQNRLNKTVQLVKRAIDKKRFGKIYMVIVNVLWTRPQKYYDAAKWRGTWELDGGAFMNQASHYVDMVEWLIGPVDSVMAHTGTLARKIETEDTGAVSIRFRNGAIGSINVTMLTYPKNLEGSITILGEKGTVRIGGVAVNKIEEWTFEEYDDDDKLVEEVEYIPDNVYGFGHLGYYENVIKTLRGTEEANTDGRSGKKSVELIQAIYLSSRDGEKVNLPLKF